jgi:hypothetical protein
VLPFQDTLHTEPVDAQWGYVTKYGTKLGTVGGEEYYPLSTNALMGHGRGEPHGPCFEADAKRGAPCDGPRQDKHAPTSRA